MKPWLLYAVCFALLLSVPTALVHAQAAQTPLWPSARTSGWNLGLDGLADSDKTRVYDWAARHYDFVNSIDGRFLDYVRSINPTIGGLGRYEIFTCVIAGSPTEQVVADAAAAAGLDIEDAFLHYNRNVVSPTRASSSSYDTLRTRYPWLGLEYDSARGNYKVHVPGWDPANDRDGDGYVNDTEFATLVNPNATARRKAHSRYVNWSWDPPRGPQWQTSLHAYEILTALIDTFEADLDQPANSGQLSGYGMMFLDSLGGWLDYSSLLLEYPHQAGGDAQADWRSDMAKLAAYTKQAYGDRVLIGGGGTHYEVGKELDVIISEGLINTWSTAGQWEGALPGGQFGVLNPQSGYYRLRQDNKIQLLQHQYNLLFYIADRPDVWARDRIYGVASYYLLQNPGYDHWAAYRGYGYWPTLETNEKMWSRALEVDIGQPTGAVPEGNVPLTYWAVWVFAEGADPGHPDYPDITKCRYKVYAREYSGGLVLLKPKSGNDPARSTFADNTATTHDLGDWYQIVYDDGTLGPPISSVTLRNGEAAILVRPRVTVGLTVSPTAAGPGGTVTYEATCINPLPSAVSNAKIEARIPVKTTYVSGSATLDGVPITPEFLPDPQNPGALLIRVYTPQIAAGATSIFRYQVQMEPVGGS